MNSIKRGIKFQNYDLKKSIGIFWIVILIVNILAVSITLYSNFNTQIGIFGVQEDIYSITGANIMPIFIFLIVYSIVIYHEDFALALCFGVTRKDFYVSVLVNNIVVVLSFATIQAILQMIERFAAKFLNYKLIVEFGIFNISTDNIFYIIFALAMIFLTFVSVTNLLGVLQYRYGYKFWIGFGITALLGMYLYRYITFLKSIQGLLQTYIWLGSTLKRNNIFILGLIIIVVSYTLGYVFLRKASIKK